MKNFIKNTKEVMSETLDKLNITYKMTDYTQTLDKIKGYLISSKNTPLYNSIKNHYQKQDNQTLFNLILQGFKHVQHLNKICKTCSFKV